MERISTRDYPNVDVLDGAGAVAHLAHWGAWGELTNRCACELYDDTVDEFVPSLVCYGDCWADQVDAFHYAVSDLLELSDKWSVEGFRLWHGEVSGVFRATTVPEFIRGVTVDAEFVLTYRVFADRMEFSLAHHDAPTGSKSVVRPHYDDTEEWD